MESNDFINYISSIINNDMSNNDMYNTDISNNDMSNNDMSNNYMYNTDISNNYMYNTDISNNNVYDNNVYDNGLSRLYSLINRITNITNNSITNNAQNILQTSLGQTNRYIQVISEQGLLDLEHLTYEDDKLKKCPIRYIDFKKGDKIIKLPCKHIFDEESILQWLKEESNKCPVCRFSMDFKEKKVDTNKPSTTATTATTDTATTDTATTDTDTTDTDTTDTTDSIVEFENFISSYYQRQEDRMVQIALQRSLIES